MFIDLISLEFCLKLLIFKLPFKFRPSKIHEHFNVCTLTYNVFFSPFQPSGIPPRIYTPSCIILSLLDVNKPLSKTRPNYCSKSIENPSTFPPLVRDFRDFHRNLPSTDCRSFSTFHMERELIVWSGNVFMFFGCLWC